MTTICEKQHQKVSSRYKSVALINITNPIIADYLMELFPNYLQRNNGRYPADECMRIDNHTIGVLINDKPERLDDLLNHCLSNDFQTKNLPSKTKGSISYNLISSFNKTTSDRDTLNTHHLLHIFKK